MRKEEKLRGLFFTLWKKFFSLGKFSTLIFQLNFPRKSSAMTTMINDCSEMKAVWRFFVLLNPFSIHSSLVINGRNGKKLIAWINLDHKCSKTILLEFFHPHSVMLKIYCIQ
jgi:hypothetical protein